MLVFSQRKGEEYIVHGDAPMLFVIVVIVFVVGEGYTIAGSLLFGEVPQW